ncbi:MAG TPA: hypothetical protein VF150_02785 [Thermoanaerobaculia bacterium]
MKTEDFDRLRETLRRGDPAADGRAPSEDEVRLLRARLLAAAPEPAPPGRHALRPAWAGGLAAAAVALTLAAAWLAGLLPVERPWAGEARYAGPPPDPSGPTGRQVQFTTPGGTRIVWVLYPDDPSYPDTSTEGRGRRGPGGRS